MLARPERRDIDEKAQNKNHGHIFVLRSCEYRGLSRGRRKANSHNSAKADPQGEFWIGLQPIGYLPVQRLL